MLHTLANLAFVLVGLFGLRVIAHSLTGRG
jgi:hypothetical protein